MCMPTDIYSNQLYACKYVHVSVFVYVCVRVIVHRSKCTLSAYIHIICVYVCVYVYMCVCMYVCMHACMYIYIYMYIYICVCVSVRQVLMWTCAVYTELLRSKRI